MRPGTHREALFGTVFNFFSPKSSGFRNMAKSKKSYGVILGFRDEKITEKHKLEVGYWTNKVGGCPDWPVDGIPPPNCHLCGLVQPLVVQINAPLANSQYHRILYVFCCINPNCWNHNESWTCLRCQIIDSEYDVTATPVVNKTAIDWCEGAEDWDDDNGNFENGSTKPMNQCPQSDNDSDEDSSSLSAGIGNLNVDEFNANYGNFEKTSGAVGKLMPPVATAEIEKEENEIVSIDTPTTPQKDLLALLEEAAPVPYYLRYGEKSENISLSFVPYFISLGEEWIMHNNSDHIKELLLQYQKNHGDFLHHGVSQGREGVDGSSEDYEKAVPAHGDKMFHNFLTRIQCNPGQIIRYNRDSELPLLLYPLQEHPRTCEYCSGDVVFEMQLLPTIIPKLKFPGEEETRVEFGTVLIFTCKRSCWSSDDTFKREKIIVQVEKT